MKVTTKSFFAYTLLPRIIPMVRDLFRPGFGLVSMSIAQIYSACGLLPANHPYLNRHNMGRYGLGQLIIEAGRNLKFDRKHADQVAIFSLIALGMTLLFAQVFIFGFVIFTQVAHAMPTNYTGFFVTQNPDQDIAFVLLDRVFGIPDFFNSCASTGGICFPMGNNPQPEVWPQPYHAAMRDMLSFYSVGLCVVAMIIFMYYVVAVFLETAESGTPFGKRFDHVWAPIRMVVALGLLIPISYGLNGAQILTLYVAKWGSSFATNGWLYFTDTLIAENLSNLLADPEQLVGNVQKSDGAQLFQFYTVVSACKKMYKAREGIDIDAYLVKNVAANESSLLTDNDWASASAFYDNNDILVVFGEKNDRYTKEKGNVKPWCGQIVLPTVDLTDAGAIAIQEAYFQRYLLDFWGNASTGNPTLGAAPQLPAPNNEDQDFFFNAADRTIEASIGPIANGLRQSDNAMWPNDDARNALLSTWSTDMDQYITIAIQQAIADAGWMFNLQEYGWAGAGIWYNKLAEKNGGMFTAVASLPMVREWPLVMEAVSDTAGRANQERSDSDKFLVSSKGNKTIELPPELGLYRDEYAKVFNDAYLLWGSTVAKEVDITGNSIPPHTITNPFTDFLRQLFGTTGLYNMAANTNIHPLAQITIMGKYLLEASVRNIALGTGGSLLAKTLSDLPRGFAEVVASLLQKIGMMTLAVGLVLYYVVPFMPFLYFFFQVGGWIKGMFEAMVGLPLWALAHLRIDNHGGLAGPAAIQGYFLILELFLRPILTIFGLVGGIAIFSAQVKVLNEIFNLVVTNVTGFDTDAALSIAADQIGWFGYYRGYIDQLFYTIIYAIIVYMLGTSSFKLVYMIPDKTLRWMGASVESFGDEIAQQNPEHLVGKMFGGASMATSSIGGSLNRLTK
jgi:conjugal transfer/type IV secretion protein DotA/TraY